MQDSNLFHDEGITLFGSLVGVKLHRSSNKKIQQQRKVLRQQSTDMEFVQNFTPPDFQAKNFTPSISPNFNSFSIKKKHKK